VDDVSKAGRRKVPWILGVFVLFLLGLLILLQSSNVWKTFSVETASDTLLLYALSSLNFVAFIIFGFIFLRNLIKLTRERKTLALGARIKTRLLIYFVAISILPIIAMAVFSYLFMNRALERWFTQIPENVVRQSREVQDRALEDQAAKLKETARMLAAVLDKRDLNTADLNGIAAAGNLTRIEILSKDSKTLNVSGKKLGAEQTAELERTLGYVRDGKLTEPILLDGKGFDAAVAELSDGRKLVIVPDLRVEESVSQLVDSSLDEFDKIKDKQFTIRQIGLLTLGVLTFLLLFASTWTAFYVARGLTVPIKALAEGADEIAKGNLGHHVDVLAEDELAILVDSFNQMSSKLEENSAALSEGRKYIETVLQSLSTGVISFDADDRVSTINRAAIYILRLENADFGKFELKQLVNEENRVVLERLISRAKRIGHAGEQTVLRRENVAGRSDNDANLPVALIATALPDGGGAVLVIEDLSELIAAQRASAWQEVARRMAHEIKNPLTPIQLSAERIAKKFAASQVAEAVPARVLTVADDRTGQVVKEGTATILREVQSLKSMVDEFSRFARLPSAKLEPGNVNEIVEQVASMYDERFEDITLDVNLAANLPGAMVDSEQLKRVFVNLIENSLEAVDDEIDEKRITISTRHDAARDLIVAELADNGKGIDPADFQKLFQPYFSTKGRGTGLGLAIVDRIVTEHAGRIKVVANQPKGAKFIIEIPAAATN
jgi:two-component system, NtrC family, nitrogen regulation sensor histidine kinase NtrY